MLKYQKNSISFKKNLVYSLVEKERILVGYPYIKRILKELRDGRECFKTY